jgi:hypothetical protein
VALGGEDVDTSGAGTTWLTSSASAAVALKGVSGTAALVRGRPRFVIGGPRFDLVCSLPGACTMPTTARSS